ncbi:hypothetical protein CMQ_7055 [Grosmannia clavigera kw1407]|uniref:Uncharacterized protein n=1 Tax=Grosmannia clavigera (strain kw1407 / UAMH 11150) TaxID=655863 RepID=F0XQ37_GROCL|nr:uncharacterized protein CMQ_7055 [Grosmannia clavigera kw1407]EFX00053.1 hypothetical protein CMQ_7055 [Grosmannia clavigera kw1407]
MARIKNSAKSASKSAANNDAALTASSTPATRRTAPTITVRSEPRKTRKTRTKEETGQTSGKGRQDVKTDRTYKVVKHKQKPKESDDEQDEQDEEQDVGGQDKETEEGLEHAKHESSDRDLHSLLPGALSPSVDTSRALGVIAVCAIVSSALSLASHMLVNWITSTSTLPPPWAAWTSYLGAMALPSALTPISSLAIRMCKISLAWGRITNVVALDVLAYGPMVYLFAVLHCIPLPAALVVAAIDLIADVLPLLAWKRLADSTTSDDDDDDGVDEAGTIKADLTSDSGGFGDPVTYACSAAFASALYSFTFVQACRLYLPRIFVVHFWNIATVKPVRTLPISATFPPSVSEFGKAVFLGWPSVVLSLVCGVAAYSFIFTGTSSPPSASPSYKKFVAVRTAALSLVVSTNIFLQCFMGVRGIDVVGALTYAAVWAAAPLLVGAALALARS